MVIKIFDFLLIENINKNVAKINFLHNDTKIALKSIYDKIIKIFEESNPNLEKNSKQDNNVSFTHKDVIEDIVPIWGWVIQDAINELKCCDFREHAKWNRLSKSDIRDINNEIAFGVERLLKYFKEFAEFERVLYGVDASYRDHVIHVFRVWLLGMFFLLNEDGNCFSIKTLEIDQPLNLGISVYTNDEVFSMWALISLCHDLGYPLEKTEKINESVEKMFHQLGKVTIQKFSVSFQLEHQFINKFLLDFISSKVLLKEGMEDSKELKDLTELVKKINQKKFFDEKERINFRQKLFGTNIQSKYYLKYSKSLENYSHGIISCSILLKALFYFLESDFNIQDKTYFSFEDARQFLIRREILRSIASHTCPEVYHLKTNTLSFLLILCDELQEWGRPRFGEMKSGYTNSGIKSIQVLNYSKEKVEFLIEYKGIMKSEEYMKKQFRRWHAILRSAVDDSDRDFSVIIELHFSENEKYKFLYQNGRLSVNSIAGKTKPIEIYDLDKVLKSYR